MLHDRISSAPIQGTRAAAALFAPFLDGLESERLGIAHLDGELRLLDVTICPPGGEACVCVPLRCIVRDALRVDARGLIIAHNHPRGDSSPSEADKKVTRRIRDVMRELDIRVIDHILFAGPEVTSFRALSLL